LAAEENSRSDNRQDNSYDKCSDGKKYNKNTAKVYDISEIKTIARTDTNCSNQHQASKHNDTYIYYTQR
jgi:hypothetical protein